MKRTLRVVRNEQGVSLLELMLYIAIAVSVLSVVSLIFVIIIQGRVKNQSISEVEQQGYQIMQIITRTVRNSEGVYNLTSGGSGSSLEVNTMDAGADPTIFSLDSGTLQMTEGGGNAINLHNDQVTTTSIQFRNLTSDNQPFIRVELTLERNNIIGRNEYEYSQTFYGSALVKEQ